MKRILTALTLLLASCDEMKPIGVVSMPRNDVSNAVHERFRFWPYLEDESYHTVHQWEIEKADHEAFRPWLKESWDCDDQSAELVRWLRADAAKKWRGSAPAVGRVNARRLEDGIKHSFVWWMDSEREIYVWDAMERERSNISGNPFIFTDK